MRRLDRRTWLRDRPVTRTERSRSEVLLSNHIYTMDGIEGVNAVDYARVNENSKSKPDKTY